MFRGPQMLRFTDIVKGFINDFFEIAKLEALYELELCHGAYSRATNLMWFAFCNCSSPQSKEKQISTVPSAKQGVPRGLG